MYILKSEDSKFIFSFDHKLFEKKEDCLNYEIEERQRRKEEIERHRHIHRNDICPCKSGLKYKKCCLPIIQSYEH